jgi:hypothetical protein
MHHGNCPPPMPTNFSNHHLLFQVLLIHQHHMLSNCKLHSNQQVNVNYITFLMELKLTQVQAHGKSKKITNHNKNKTKKTCKQYEVLVCCGSLCCLLSMQSLSLIIPFPPYVAISKCNEHVHINEKPNKASR